MVSVNMPIVGQDIPTGIIKEWFKKEGDAVSKDEIIATVESEKATFDVEAPADGILLKILRHEDEEVKVLTAIAYIGKEGETLEVAEGIEAKPQKTIINKSGNDIVEIHSTAPENKTKIFVSPLARKIAEKEGILLESLLGTGPGGRIIKRNVLDAMNAKSNPDADRKTFSGIHEPEIKLSLSEGEKEVPYDRIRQLIADKLTLSKQTVPHFYLFADVVMDAAIALKERLKEENVRVTITDMVVHSVAKAMDEFPRMNSNVYSNRYVLLRDINIGLAVTTIDGLRVPVIIHADKGDLSELAARTKKLSANAKSGRMEPGLKSGLTVSTLGMYGINQFLPIINPPECAILAVGQSSPKVVTDGTSISIKNIMTITIACDHRLIDGAYAANFIGRVKEILEQADFKKLNW